MGGGVRLRLNGTEGAQACLWSQRVQDPAWGPSRLLGPEWVEQMPSAPLLLLWSRRDPPTCLSCSPLASLLCFQDQHHPEGASEGTGPGLRARQSSQANWTGETLSALSPDPNPQRSLQAWKPLPPSHPSGVPVLSSPHFSSTPSPPTSYRFAWGFLPSPWALRSPTSVRQVPELWGDVNSVFPCHHLDSTFSQNYVLIDIKF